MSTENELSVEYFEWLRELEKNALKFVLDGDWVKKEGKEKMSTDEKTLTEDEAECKLSIADPKGWIPEYSENLLFLPADIEPPEGYAYSWGTYSVYGAVDYTNIKRLKKTGRTPVPADRHPNLYSDGSVEDGDFISRKGSVLMESEKTRSEFRSMYDINCLPGVSETGAPSTGAYLNEIISELESDLMESKEPVYSAEPGAGTDADCALKIKRMLYCNNLEVRNNAISGIVSNERLLELESEPKEEITSDDEPWSELSQKALEADVELFGLDSLIRSSQAWLKKERRNRPNNDETEDEFVKANVLRLRKLLKLKIKNGGDLNIPKHSDYPLITQHLSIKPETSKEEASSDSEALLDSEDLEAEAEHSSFEEAYKAYKKRCLKRCLKRQIEIITKRTGRNKKYKKVVDGDTKSPTEERVHIGSWTPSFEDIDYIKLYHPDWVSKIRQENGKYALEIPLDVVNPDWITSIKKRYLKRQIETITKRINQNKKNAKVIDGDTKSPAEEVPQGAQYPGNPLALSSKSVDEIRLRHPEWASSIRQDEVPVCEDCQVSIVPAIENYRPYCKAGLIAFIKETDNTKNGLENKVVGSDTKSSDKGISQDVCYQEVERYQKHWSPLAPIYVDSGNSLEPFRPTLKSGLIAFIEKLKSQFRKL